MKNNVLKFTNIPKDERWIIFTEININWVIKEELDRWVVIYSENKLKPFSYIKYSF